MGGRKDNIEVMGVDVRELRENLEKRGYKLRRIIHYKHRDAIVVEGRKLTMTFHLKYKISDLRWEDIEDLFPRGGK